MTAEIYEAARASFERLPRWPDKDKLHAIARAAEDVHGVMLHDLRRNDRTAPLIFIRQEAMLLAHEHGVSAAKIGEFFHRDHTTVLAAIKAATKRRKENTCSPLSPAFSTLSA